MYNNVYTWLVMLSMSIMAVLDPVSPDCVAAVLAYNREQGCVNDVRVVV